MSDAESDADGREEGPVLGVRNHFSDLQSIFTISNPHRSILETEMKGRSDMEPERINFQMETFTLERTPTESVKDTDFTSGRPVTDSLESTLRMTDREVDP